MYIGPVHTFDDDDLEYLNKDDTEDINESLQKIKPSPPISSQSIDSLSGIYLGFAEKERRISGRGGERKVSVRNVKVLEPYYQVIVHSGQIFKICACLIFLSEHN